MDEVILAMLAEYHCKTDIDYENALKEIMQEIALAGLWRAKFFEHAAFYGGTALRILYRLNRFSEDLDFSLLKPNKQFNLDAYLNAIQSELQAFGFDTTIQMKEKNIDTDIQSAFLKANTQTHLIRTHAPPAIQQVVHQQKQMKIKLEIDIDPPGHFNTETKTLIRPIPFWVKSYCLPDLFAGKLSAVLGRQWQTRVKGRDWYDFVWFAQRQTPLHLVHLEARLRQFGYYKEKSPLEPSTVKQLLMNKIQQLDITQAKNDIKKFIKNTSDLQGWSVALFTTIVKQLTFV
ncbi:MAG: hypothetical protein A3C55_05790 [Gammaproteobacteria bacterium RIFCSPHIGHO2_02_FULL_42_13]|nr:MAG: hypothetical protein A3C55_05790 [Gammaproteobacteria bacterium RIFCSPHIGHO2_02_FULL_42_13]OGT69426.1 MAG: hypothetical protein A3H43_05430 [Gammaproteobacteria bacterium RIFCSPLOWO2_02_FULL_42_9]